MCDEGGARRQVAIQGGRTDRQTHTIDYNEGFIQPRPHCLVAPRLELLPKSARVDVPHGRRRSLKATCITI